MNDYKLLKKAYLDNTRYDEKYLDFSMDFSGLKISGNDFSINTMNSIDPVLMMNKNRQDAKENETGFVYLSNYKTKCKYRVINSDSLKDSPQRTYTIEVNFPENQDVNQDINNIFNELCIYPSTYRATMRDPSRKFEVPFVIGDTVKFYILNTLYEGGIIKDILIGSYNITHLNKLYNVNALNDITLTMANSNTCKISRNIKNPNNTGMYYTYKKIPIERLKPDKN